MLLCVVCVFYNVFLFTGLEHIPSFILPTYLSTHLLGSGVVSVLDSDAEGPGSNSSRDAVV